MFANAINRRASDSSVRANNRAALPGGSQTNEAAPVGNGDDSQPPLSEDEIRGAIAKVENRPNDIPLQHNFGMALYRYANQTQDARLLPDVARILKRAYETNPKDYELTVTLANALFDIGQTSDPARFNEARRYYAKALEMRPDDVDVRTDLGLTYYFGQPSDPQRAIAEYRKSIALNPRHEATLQNLAAALINVGNREEAEQRVNELQKLNPAHPALPNLRTQLAQSKIAARE